MRAADPRLPTMVIGGYLGAGKTTLVNHLLRHAGDRRIAVLVNDFGDIGIDADLIESRDGAVLNLAGGCICCSFGSDLIGALVGLPSRVPTPDVVLIETSGVALPGAVARGARLAPGIDVEGVVVLVDAETIRERAADRYVGDTVLQQLRDADLLLVNKLDLVDARQLAAVRGWLAEHAPSARTIETVDSAVPPDVVLGFAGAANGPPAASRPPSDARGASLGVGPRVAPRRDGAGRTFASHAFRLARPVDARALAAALADRSTGVVRAKGLVFDVDGSPVTLQVAGRRWTVSAGPPRVTGSGRDEPGSGRLLVIGLRGRLDREALSDLVAGHAAPA